MDNEMLLKKLEQIYNKFTDGLQGEFDGYEGTDDQPDARLIEVGIALEDLIDELKE